MFRDKRVGVSRQFAPRAATQVALASSVKPLQYWKK